ncbi:MAG TPA: diacylglycerol kinase family protein [Tepidisphaeraceae bacterium]|nr:diacylglycerol kinase family protein [Tepidisphaeraceae bacterium]
MKWMILLNGAAGTILRSGGTTVNDQLQAALSQHGIDAELKSVEGDQLAATARDAARRKRYDVIAAAGGDGTLNAVASGLLDTGATFAPLPLGTHNHFAKDMGIPLDLAEAIALLADGVTIDLPIGLVNDNLFLNFSGVGLHPRVVRHRDAQRSALDRGKWTAMGVAFTRAMMRFPIIRVTLTVKGVRLRRATPSVIVCNNAHQMEVFGVQAASYPDRRVLNTYVAKPRGRTGMLWLMAKASVGKLEPTANFEVIVSPELQVATRGRTVRVSIDGEVIDCTSPLMYRVRQGALKVLVPREQAARFEMNVVATTTTT